MQFEQIEITPELAKQYLKRNAGNRPLDKNIVNHYSDQMVDGQWVADTGEAIKFDVADRLVDGQHRLQAVILYGKGITFWVCRGVPKEAFLALDKGKKRSLGDNFSIREIKNANQVSAVVNSYLKIQNSHFDTDKTVASRSGITDGKVLEEYNKRPEFWQNLTNKCSTYCSGFNRTISISLIGSFYAHFYALAPNDVDRFFEKLCFGIGIDGKKDPIYVLRHILQDDKANKKGKIKPTYRAAIIIKAWNLFRQNNNNVGLITWKIDKEKFPIAS